MALKMKDRFARLDLSKLPESYKSEFDEMDKSTYGFTDEDLNDIFAENFNEMYGMVEKKYPDAIKTGGTIKKVKPAKVKKVTPKKEPDVEHPKTEKEFALPEKIEKEIHRKKLSSDDIEFIESALTNDEASTDEELAEYFVKELGITEAQAKKWVAKRNKYLQQPVEKAVSYKVRTELKKEARKIKDNILTRDGKKFNRRSKKNVGKTFYDENGKPWKCKGYNARLDECIFEDESGKEISGCLKDMYVSNHVKKREKGDLVDECKDTLKEAGYTVKEHKAGKKKIKRAEPRPEREIIKERVEDTFKPILKDISGSEEKEEKNKDTIAALKRIQGLFTKLFNRLNNLAEDGKTEDIEKIEKLLKELVG